MLMQSSTPRKFMRINQRFDWLSRQLSQFHGQCHICLAYNLRERFNGNESWSLSEFNAIQVWTWGSRMWNVVTLPRLRNCSAANAYWPIDINLLPWSLSIALPVENVWECHTKWHMLINIHAGSNACSEMAPKESGQWDVGRESRQIQVIGRKRFFIIYVMKIEQFQVLDVV